LDTEHSTAINKLRAKFVNQKSYLSYSLKYLKIKVQTLIQLLLIPGLGGDHRMTHTQLTLPYTLITPDYIPFERDETLSAYAKRFCEHLLKTHEIHLDHPLFIGGYSMGGAIGIELTKILQVRGLILIGSLLSSDDIGLIPRIFGRYVSGWLPLWGYRALDWLIAPVMRKYSGIGEYEVMLCVAMYRDLPRGLFREAYHALARWKGAKITVPFVRIHGANDHIITCPKQGADVIIIPNSKHLVGQTKAGLVNEAIETFISRVTQDDR
jgi:pimeloyl-ACP methyl ester carboxylesterase